MMNYEEAIAFLESRIRYGIRPGTERVQALAKALGEPQRSYEIVHVSGTNGKFSVVQIVSAILTELGLVTGTYTSPHLETVRERIALAGEPIDEDTFAGVVTYLGPYLEHVEAGLQDELTYFELLTIMGFEAFFDRAVHVGVVEAGLGGEYDATNVAEARVAIVTNVTVDHVPQFGRDLRKAAWEKAGIAKPGSFVVTGVEQDELFDIVAERAVERGVAGVARLGREIDVLARGPAVGGQVMTVRGLHATYDELFCALFGAHQSRNVALAVAACEAFTGERLDDEALRQALASVRTPGRVDVVGQRPIVICDGGHNPAAALAVREAVEESFSFDRLHLVAGMLEDKLVGEVLGVWTEVAERFVLTAPRAERAASADALRESLEGLKVPPEKISMEPTVAQALQRALDEATEDGLVLVCGSFYTVGEALPWLRSRGVLAQA